MKKILGITGFIGFFSFMAWSLSYAYQPVWRASHTATADTTQILCRGTQYLVAGSTITNGNLGILHGVCVNDAGAVSGAITIYDSSSTATNAFAVLRATAAVNQGCMFYDVQVSSGLVYTTGAANDVTFLYTCF